MKVASADEPDFTDVFYLIGASGKLIQLERQDSTRKIGNSAILFAKAELVVPGSKSPVRVRSDRDIDLVVRSLSQQDPGQLYQVRRVVSKKNARTALIGSATPIGGKQAPVIHFEFSRYKQGSIRISLRDLKPGEYSIGMAHGEVLYLFGVD